jgi:uncharacterized protein YqfA (UPF0365 family)
MSETLVAAGAILAIAAGAFIISVRIGMLVGLRLDRVLEASYKAQQESAVEAALDGTTDPGPVVAKEKRGE